MPRIGSEVLGGNATMTDTDNAQPAAALKDEIDDLKALLLVIKAQLVYAQTLYRVWEPKRFTDLLDRINQATWEE